MVKQSILALLMCFVFSQGMQASHIAGAEISYKYLYGNTYQFKVKVFRDCRECKFNNSGGGDNTTSCNEVPDLNIRGSVGTPYFSTASLGTIEIERTAIRDLTMACYGSMSKCRNSSSIPYGFEEHIFEGTYDFTSLVNQGYCKLDISIGMSSRNININPASTEQNFFNYATLNLCERLPNQSTEFRNPPHFVHLLNQSQFQSLGIGNDDGDSLAFNLRPALSNRTTNVSYASGRSYTMPFTYYCGGSSIPPCTPNIMSPVVEGFYWSGATGDIAFTPTMNQGGVIVMECEEWKKDGSGNYFLAGVTRRDIYSDVITLNNNLPKIKNNTLDYTICEGEKLVVNITTEDAPFMGAGYDSVTVNMVSTMDNSRITLGRAVVSTPPYNLYTLSLLNTNGIAGRHYITLTARDNNCPLRGSVEKTIVVNILKRRDIKITYSVKNCGFLDVATGSPVNRNIFWTIRDMDQNIIRQQLAKKASVQLTKGGKYIVNAYLPAEPGFCEINRTDTIDVKPFTMPVLNMGADRTVCRGSQVSLGAVTLNTYDKYKVLVNGNLTTLPYDIKVNDAKVLQFRVIQDDGCVVEDNVKLSIFPTLIYSIAQDTACVNEVFPRLVNNIKVNKTDIASIDMQENNASASLAKLNNTDWQLDLATKAINRVVINSRIQDKNLCPYLDTFEILVIEPQPITVSAPADLCRNAGMVVLQSMNKGSWECINEPAAVNNNVVDPYSASASKLELRYTEQVGRCSNSKTAFVDLHDTDLISFIQPKATTLCENASSYELKATPQGGTWTGNHVSNGYFEPKDGKGETTSVVYTYKNAAGCISRDAMVITVDPLPTLTVKADKAKICVGSSLGLQAMTSYLGQGYWYTDGAGHFDSLNSLATNYLPSINDVNGGNVTFIYTLQTNGVCGNVSSRVSARIVDGPKGEIRRDYPLTTCERAEITFTSTFSDIDKQYWFINDSLVEDFDYNFPMTAGLDAGEYVIKTKVYNSACEALAISENIQVLPRPTVKLLANPTLKLSREYPRLYLKDLSYSKYGHSVNWYFNDEWISDSRELNYKVPETRDSFHIKLVVTSDKLGCSDSINQLFIFIPINQLYIPDAFSPDARGPEENNVFKVYGPAMKVYEIEIYNKYGQKVYMSQDMNAAWDGTFMGKICMQGAYFYKIITTDYEGVSRDYSGTITILR